MNKELKGERGGRVDCGKNSLGALCPEAGPI